MKKVVMTQQVSGSRDGKPWPEPGVEVEVTEAEARSLIHGNVAQEVGYRGDTVLVPPTGVHTPGRTAYGNLDLVEVPVDAVTDAAGATAAYKAAQAGNVTKSVPAGTGVQNHDGSAMTDKAIDKSLDEDKQTAKDLGLPSTEEKAPASTSGPTSTVTPKSGTKTADKSTK